MEVIVHKKDNPCISEELYEIIKANNIDKILNEILDKKKELCILKFMGNEFNGDELKGTLKIIIELKDVFIKMFDKSSEEK